MYSEENKIPFGCWAARMAGSLVGWENDADQRASKLDAGTGACIA